MDIEIERKLLSAKLNVGQLKLVMLISLNKDSSGVFKLKNEEILSRFQDAGYSIEERALQKWIKQLKDEQIITVRTRKRERFIRLNYAKKQYSLEYPEMSEAQRKFKDAFPKRQVNADVPDTVDMDSLILKIKNSKKLMRYEFTSLRWFVENYDRVMNGEWDNTRFQGTDNELENGRTYNNEEVNSYSKSADEIEIGEVG